MRPIKEIIIVGNHNAAWMTAAALGKVLAGICRVVVVQSAQDQDAIEGFGACERVLPGFAEFIRLLGTTENNFLESCDALVDPGTEYRGWNGEGNSYIFGPGIAAGDRTDFNVHGIMPKGYILDSSRFLAWLRGLAQKANVVRRDCKSFQVELHESTRGVQAVTLDNGERLEADLFIDCSGSQGVLMRSMGIEIEDWSDYLPIDRIITAPCGQDRRLTDTPSVTAREAGWQWRIPLRNRVSNGYAFASRHRSYRRTVADFKDFLENSSLMPPKVQSIQTGRRKSAWVGNVIAIGAAAGVVEPLEPIGIYLIQSAIQRLLKRFPDQTFPGPLLASYCRETQAELENVRDFLAMKYLSAPPIKGKFWSSRSEWAVPESLAERLTAFYKTGIFSTGPEQVFTSKSWRDVLSHHEFGISAPTRRRKRTTPALILPEKEILCGRYNEMPSIL